MVPVPSREIDSRLPPAIIRDDGVVVPNFVLFLMLRVLLDLVRDPMMGLERYLSVERLWIHQVESWVR